LVEGARERERKKATRLRRRWRVVEDDERRERPVLMYMRCAMWRRRRCFLEV